MRIEEKEIWQYQNHWFPIMFSHFCHVFPGFPFFSNPQAIEDPLKK